MERVLTRELELQTKQKIKFYFMGGLDYSFISQALVTPRCSVRQDVSLTM